MVEKRLLPLDIQLFAEEPEEGKGENGKGGEAGQTAPTPGLPKTQEELDALIKARLERERAKPGKQPEDAKPAGEIAAQEPPPPDNAIQRELVEARAQVAAMKEGILPAAIEDAVCLAVHAAEKQGEVTQEAVAKALQDVVKRHPEWKPDDGGKAAGGFRVGAGDGDGKKTEDSAVDEQLAAIFGIKSK